MAPLGFKVFDKLLENHQKGNFIEFKTHRRTYALTHAYMHTYVDVCCAAFSPLLLLGGHGLWPAMFLVGGDERFNATMLFGDISYAGVDTNVKPFNITSADEWEHVWDLFGEQVRIAWLI